MVAPSGSRCAQQLRGRLVALCLVGTTAAAWVRPKCGTPNAGQDVITAWGRAIDPSRAGTVHAEYPRPTMVRGGGAPSAGGGVDGGASAGPSAWRSLNGMWQWEAAADAAALASPPFGVVLNGSILVPFPPEACLSGVGANASAMFYRTTFDAPSFGGAATAAAAANTAESAAAAAAKAHSSRTLLHFGAVDWNCTVYLNGAALGRHAGGYDGFSFELTAGSGAAAAAGAAALKPRDNELIVAVHDPSEYGAQPMGKQRSASIAQPGGDRYTSTSGIWQSVWLEAAPAAPGGYISALRVGADLREVSLLVTVSGAAVVAGEGGSEGQAAMRITAEVFDGGSVVATLSGVAGQLITAAVPSPKLWTPERPFLYGLRVVLGGGADAVSSYFGMRTFTMAPRTSTAFPASGPQRGVERRSATMSTVPQVTEPRACEAACAAAAGCVAWGLNVSSAACDLKHGYGRRYSGSNEGIWSGTLARGGKPVQRPLLNGNFTFLAGWLDQSWWPDGQYTAPSDAALASDLAAAKSFGLNLVRLHQKVNPERWYFHADKLGVAVFQDGVQHFGEDGADAPSAHLFRSDYTAMLHGRANHPSVLQWTVFNEADCVTQLGNAFAAEMVRFTQDFQAAPGVPSYSRLVDADSGGPANALHLGDVYDNHDYPDPNDFASVTPAAQYTMIGEFGGIGAFVGGKEWVPGQCHTYLEARDPAEEADDFVRMVGALVESKVDVSVSVYTQITDVELECDGFLNYDRTSKFNASATDAIAAANRALIEAPA